VGRQKLSTLASLFVLLNIIDFFVTWYGVNSSSFQEINPIAAAILRMGPWALLAFKVTVPLAVALILVKYNKRRILIAAIIGMFLVCLWNWIVLVTQ